jgi:hypothetical protein
MDRSRRADRFSTTSRSSALVYPFGVLPDAKLQLVAVERTFES